MFKLSDEPLFASPVKLTVPPEPVLPFIEWFLDSSLSEFLSEFSFSTFLFVLLFFFFCFTEVGLVSLEISLGVAFLGAKLLLGTNPDCPLLNICVPALFVKLIAPLLV